MRWMDGSELSVRDMTAAQFLEKLSDEQYHYDETDWMQMPDWAQNAAFIMAFDTELSMEGVLTFLENSIGHYAPEIIRAFRAIGDEQDADILAEICRIAPPDAVRGEWTEKEYQEYDITSFNANHSLSDETIDRIEELEQELYLNTDFDMWKLLNDYTASCMKEA